MLAEYGGGPEGGFCSVREISRRITTIAITTAIAMPMARQLVSRSSTVGFGWMNPPMGGLYYRLVFTTETQRHRETLFLIGYQFKSCHFSHSEGSRSFHMPRTAILI